MTENKDNNKKEVSVPGLPFCVGALCLITSVTGISISKKLSRIRESIDFHNFLMLQLMIKAEEMELPDDTIPYQDAQRLYIQNMQQKNSSLSKSIAYNK